MLKVTAMKRTYPTGIKRVNDVITIWMVTLLMLVDVNMPMNLMGAGIMAAPALYPGIGRHFMFKEKNIQQCYRETIKKHNQLQDMGFVMHSIWSCDYLMERCML